jgi:hypothetical protein
MALELPSDPVSKADPISALPTEIWQIILRYSISVPDLFDPDDLVDRFPPRVITKRSWPKMITTQRTQETIFKECAVSGINIYASMPTASCAYPT